MSPLTTESLERLAVLYATAAIAGDSKRMNEVGDELRRRDEAVKVLIETAREAANMIEDQYRSVLGFASKSEKNAAVKKHIVLAPLRSAIAALDGELRSRVANKLGQILGSSNR